MTCEDCGFDFDRVGRDDVRPRVTAAVAAITQQLHSDSDALTKRPEAQRWSVVEYASHVRDVMLTIRDRLVIGLVEDEPGFKPLYREERVGLGLYAADTPAAVLTELESATAMFLRLFDAIPAHQLGRSVNYGYPNPTRRSLLWMGLQAIHESEHHLTDITENLERL